MNGLYVLLSRLPQSTCFLSFLRISVLLIGFLFASSELLFGQSINHNVKVLITHNAVTEHDDHIEQILNKTALIQTEKLGFSGVSLETDEDSFIPHPGSEWGPFKENVSGIMRPNYKDADLLVIGFYRIEQEEISIEYFCVESGFFSLLAFRRNTVPIDFALDRSVSTTIENLFHNASGKIKRIAEAKEQEEEKAAEYADMQQISQKKERAPETVEDNTAAGGTAFESSASASVLFFVGEAADHFSLGVHANGSFLLPIITSRSNSVSVGLSAGYMRFFPSGPNKAKYIRSLIPFGLTTHSVIGRDSLFAWFFYGTAGGAYRFTTETIVSEYLSGVIPYVELGGGMRVGPFGDRVDLNLHASYLGVMNFYQESGKEEVSVDILSALSPGASLKVRL